MKVIKKAKDGKSFPDLNKDGKVTKADVLKGRGVIAKKGAVIKKAQAGAKVREEILNKFNQPIDEKATAKRKLEIAKNAFAAKKSAVRDTTSVKKASPKMKAGGMIKRADGSMSKRGLWDNIRANKGSGKKPTAAMLKQEKKIKAKK